MNLGSHPTHDTSPSGTPLTSVRDGSAIDRATDSARRVIDALLSTDRGNANLERVAEELASVAQHLESHAPAVEERLIDMWNGEGVTRHDPVTGLENAIAPPLILNGLSDGSVEGIVTLSLAYQGPPGHVHGGISALLLDHALGVANAWAGKTGMTAQLSTRYHRPTPLFEPLTVSGKLVNVDGRKITTVGEIKTSDGQLCVSAEGLFIDKTVPRPSPR